MSDTPGTPRSTPGRSGANRTPLNSRWVIGIVLLVLVVVFILENRQLVSIRLLIPVVLMPQWAALTLTLVIGAVIGALLARRKRP